MSLPRPLPDNIIVRATSTVTIFRAPDGHSLGDLSPGVPEPMTRRTFRGISWFCNGAGAGLSEQGLLRREKMGALEITPVR